MQRGKLRIGIWITADLKPTDGGAFGYTSELVSNLCRYEFADAEISFVGDRTYKTDGFRSHEISKWLYKGKQNIAKFIALLEATLFLKPIVVILKYLERRREITLLRRLDKNIDVIYYITPDTFITNFPFVFTLWDIGHLSMFAFPEVSSNGLFEYRDRQHKFILPQALMIFCESEIGKKQASSYLGLNPDRIKVIPLAPSSVINDEVHVCKPSLLDSATSFIHYPAQFWPHKNHYNLLIAFKDVLKTYADFKLVLTGSDKGNKSYVKDVILKLGLQENVIDLGFIAIEELKWLYINSKGLVMPTFLGPSNMPLLEAAELGCPVACSALEGHEELLGDYGFYFDPRKPNDIADKLLQMINSEGNKGKRDYISKFNITNTMLSLDASFSELKLIRYCWGNNT
jgi:glycosyltransferase involved in cell wall biosynthesis